MRIAWKFYSEKWVEPFHFKKWEGLRCPAYRGSDANDFSIVFTDASPGAEMITAVVENKFGEILAVVNKISCKQCSVPRINRPETNANSNLINRVSWQGTQVDSHDAVVNKRNGIGFGC